MPMRAVLEGVLTLQARCRPFELLLRPPEVSLVSVGCMQKDTGSTEAPVVLGPHLPPLPVPDAASLQTHRSPALCMQACEELLLLARSLAVVGYREGVCSATIFEVAAALPSALIPLVRLGRWGHCRLQPLLQSRPVSSSETALCRASDIQPGVSNPACRWRPGRRCGRRWKQRSGWSWGCWSSFQASSAGGLAHALAGTTTPTGVRIGWGSPLAERARGWLVWNRDE